MCRESALMAALEPFLTESVQSLGGSGAMQPC